jgi:FdhD protein
MNPAKVNQEGVRRHTVCRWQGSAWRQAQDDLAQEVPVALEYNGIAHAVMLATPLDLEAFALGFSLSEGIITSPADCYEIIAVPSDAGITLQIRISSAAFMLLKNRRRTMTGRTGCGVCGIESLHQLQRTLPQYAPQQTLSASGIRRALAGLERLQLRNRMTGGMHAAACYQPNGELFAGFEDVGRHNALDKLIGAMANAKIGFADGFVVLTSRASLELVQKAATVGIRALVAISAPTTLAVSTAQACGITLVGFARGNDFVAYAHSDTIRLD